MLEAASPNSRNCERYIYCTLVRNCKLIYLFNSGMSNTICGHLFAKLSKPLVLQLDERSGVISSNSKRRLFFVFLGERFQQNGSKEIHDTSHSGCSSISHGDGCCSQRRRFPPCCSVIRAERCAPPDSARRFLFLCIAEKIIH